MVNYIHENTANSHTLAKQKEGNTHTLENSQTHTHTDMHIHTQTHKHTHLCAHALTLETESHVAEAALSI